MTDVRGLLQRWRRVSARLDPSLDLDAWTTAPPPRFLSAFRPDGARLPDLFVGLPQLMPVLERLQQLFQWGGAGDGRHLQITRPSRRTDAELIQGVRAWLNSGGALTQDLGLTVGHQVRSFLRDTSARVELRDGPAPDGNHPVRSALDEAVTELSHSMTLPLVAELLVAPLLELTGSPELAWWVLSPLAPETHDDPLAPAVELWEAGVTLRFEGDGPIRALAYRQRGR